MNLTKAKAALLGATAFAAMAAAPVHAADDQTLAAAAGHAAIEIVHEEPAVQAPAFVKKVGIAALATAALAGLYRILGAKRVAKIGRAAGSAISGAAGAVAGATARAAAAVGGGMGRRMRVAIGFVGVALIALTGIDIFNVEWIFGLLAGAVAIAVAGFGGRQAREAKANVAAEAREDARTDE